jgi:imidazolonepropionase-like amidohydrolase
MKRCILLLSLLPTVCPAQTFIIRGALVFDGVKKLGIRDVLVDDGKISGVASLIQAPSRAEVIDGHGKTLLPGLFDSHVHIGGGEIINLTLRKAVLFGVTTVVSLFDAGTTPREMHELFRQQPPGELADFLTAGVGVTIKGGHGTLYGITIPTLDDARDAQSFVDARIAEGSDLIKIIYEDSGIYGEGGGILPRLPKASMKAAIDAAHARGKLAVVHAGGQVEHVRDAIEAGADGVAHSFFDSVADTDYGQMFVSHAAFLIPTFPVQASVCALPDNASLGRDPRIAPWLTKQEADRLKTAYGKPGQHRDCIGSFASIPILRDAGATILAGSDAPNDGTAYGASLHEELEIMVRCGLSPEQALISATSVAARAWGFKDRGRIAPGLRADLLLVNGDASKDIACTRDIVRIWLAGVGVDRTKLLGKVKALEQK